MNTVKPSPFTIYHHRKLTLSKDVNMGLKFSVLFFFFLFVVRNGSKITILTRRVWKKMRTQHA